MTAPYQTPPVGAPADIVFAARAVLPVLSTDRLTLRPVTVEDTSAYAEIACGEQGRYFSDAKSEDDAWGEFCQLAAGWLLHGHGGWTVQFHDAPEPLGFVLIGLEPGDETFELGFMFRKSAEGRGIAFEACTAARAYAFETLRLDALVSYIDTKNARAIAFAERLGATRDQKAESAFNGSLCVFRHPKPEAA